MPKPYHTPKSERDAAATDDAIAAGLDEMAAFDDEAIENALRLLDGTIWDQQARHACGCGPMVRIKVYDDSVYHAAHQLQILGYGPGVRGK